MSYNGWSNRETWLVNVWFNPESREDVRMARHELEEEFDSMPLGVLRDMVSLDKVNWSELEDHFDEDEDDHFDEFVEDDGQPDEAQEWHDFDPDC